MQYERTGYPDIPSHVEDMARSQMLLLAMHKWPGRSPMSYAEAIQMPMHYFRCSLGVTPLKENNGDLIERCVEQFDQAVGQFGLHQPPWDERYKWYEKEAVKDARPDDRVRLELGTGTSDTLNAYRNRHLKLSNVEFHTSDALEDFESANYLLDKGSDVLEKQLYNELAVMGNNTVGYNDRSRYPDDIAFATDLVQKAIRGTLGILDENCEVNLKLPLDSGVYFTKELTCLSSNYSKYWDDVNT